MSGKGTLDMTDTTCWCGHPATAHRAQRIDLWPSRTGVVRSALRECQAEWTEAPRTRAYCNCEQYAPAQGEDDSASV